MKIVKFDSAYSSSGVRKPDRKMPNFDLYPAVVIAAVLAKIVKFEISGAGIAQGHLGWIDRRRHI
jgi:hypothetical protein